MPIAIVLIAIFTLDFIYSNSNPNMGDGITDGFAGTEMMGDAQTSSSETSVVLESSVEAAP